MIFVRLSIAPAHVELLTSICMLIDWSVYPWRTLLYIVKLKNKKENDCMSVHSSLKVSLTGEPTVCASLGSCLGFKLFFRKGRIQSSKLLLQTK